MNSRGAFLWSSLLLLMATPVSAQTIPSACVTCPCITTVQGYELTRSDYQLVALTKLGPFSNWIERNKAITQRYADLYLLEPKRFKWAGLAAFASREVGARLEQMKEMSDALSNFRSEVTKKQCQTFRDIFWEMNSPFQALYIAAQPWSLADFTALFAAGNQLVYEDVGWMHEAYLDGGIPRVINLIKGDHFLDEPIKTDLINAWNDIDNGDVWKGSEALLKYEQQRLQSRIYNEKRDQWGRLTQAFGLKEPFENTPFLDPTSNPPRDNIAVFEQRWAWLQTNVLPKWKCLDSQGSKAVLCQFSAPNSPHKSCSDMTPPMAPLPQGRF